MIRIKCTGAETHGVEVTTQDGAPIDGVRDIKLRMAVNDVVRAEIEVVVGHVDVLAHPLLGLETIAAAAAAHGYKLVEED